MTKNSQLIEFSTIQPLTASLIDNVPDLDEIECKSSSARYDALSFHRKQSETIFEKWFEENNAQLLDEIDCFTKKSLQVDSMFPNRSERIQAVSVVLGFEHQDDESTINRIQEHVTNHYDIFNVLRIQASTHAVQDLRVITAQMKNQSLYVMIEQGEKCDVAMLKQLVHLLYERMLSRQLSTVVIMTFSAAGTFDLEHMLVYESIEIMDCHVIIKRPGDIVTGMKNKLLDGEIDAFRLGPRTFSRIASEFIGENPSINVLKHNVQVTMFNYFQRPISLLTTPKTTLSRLFALDDEFVESIRNIPSLKSEMVPNGPDKLAKFCVQKIQHLKDYHRYAMVQLNYYLVMFTDEAGLDFPTGIDDLYSELLSYNNLGESADLVNVMMEFAKTRSAKEVLKRIKRVEDLHVANGGKLPEKDDMYTILSKYLPALEKSTKNGKATIVSLINDLLQHLPKISNPLKKPLSEALFYDQGDRFGVSSPFSRKKLSQELLSESHDFGKLYRLIHEAGEDVSVHDLFYDFKDVMDGPDETQENIENQSVRKSSKRPSKATTYCQATTKKKKSDYSDDGFMKTVFLDLIDSMQYQRLIKAHTLKSKKGMLRKVAWL